MKVKVPAHYYALRWNNGRLGTEPFRYGVGKDGRPTGKAVRRALR